MAVATLRMKTAAGRLHPERFGLTVEDIGLDVIGELFRRDTAGKLVEIERYFDGLGQWRELSDEELANRLRRLVMAVVNQELHRLHGAFDPSLARIIRNLKLAAQRRPQFEVQEVQGDNALQLKGASRTNTGLPEIAPELLEVELTSRIRTNSSLADMLDAVAEVLQEQQEYRPSVSLVGLALAIRNSYVRVAPEEVEHEAADPLRPAQVDKICTRVVEELSHSPGESYLRKGRLTQAELEAHLKAVEDLLAIQFGEMDGEPETYYGLLRRHLPALTSNTYRSNHRVVLEYLAKVGKRRVWELMQKL
jgi:hypothetical protein